MDNLKIKGWETGFNKLKMIEVLTEDLQLEKDESEKLANAVSAGQAIDLKIEDPRLAKSLYGKLKGLGALVDLSQIE